MTNIMIVEDDWKIQELISLYLVNNGYQVIHAADGRSALQLFIDHKPQLVLLDINLPDIQGDVICKEIRLVSDVPIIFISSNAEPEDVIQGLDLGADDYITKPFDPNVLVSRVKANLRRAPFYKRTAIETTETGS